MAQISYQKVMAAYDTLRDRIGRPRVRGGLSTRKLYRHALRHGGNVGGLINEGNTCFMNCVIQSLALSEDFVGFVRSQVGEGLEGSILDKFGLASKKGQFLVELNSLFTKLNSLHGNSYLDYNTMTLARRMANGFEKHSFLGYNQEDAQEFFQLVLSNVEKDVEPENQDKKPVLEQTMSFQERIEANSFRGSGIHYIPFSQIDPERPENLVKGFKLQTPADGVVVERIGCLECGETGGLRYSVSSGLSLLLPLDASHSVSLDKILEEYISEEIIEGVECNRCSLVYVVSYLEKQLEHEGTPEVLRSKLEERLAAVRAELAKPIITDEAAAAYKSKNVKQKSKKTKQAFILRPPAYLSLHFNRSVFDYSTGYIRKNTCSIQFPSQLDLNRYVADTEDVNIDARRCMRKQDDLKAERRKMVGHDQNESSLCSDSGSDIFEESTMTDSAITETVSDEEKPVTREVVERSEIEEKSAEVDQVQARLSEIDSELSLFHKPLLIYNLKACIVHYGTHNYGHYIAFRKYRGVWWRILDETVEVVEESQVLSTPGVFMLFYEHPDSLDRSTEVQLDENGEIDVGDEEEEEEAQEVEIAPEALKRASSKEDSEAAFEEDSNGDSDIGSLYGDQENLDETMSIGPDEQFPPSDASIDQGKNHLEVISKDEASQEEAGFENKSKSLPQEEKTMAMAAQAL